MTKYVHGTYKTAEEANATVDSLIAKGYDSSDITLVSNDATNSYLSTNVHTKVYGENHSKDESLVDKIKDVFTDDKEDTSNDTTENENVALDGYTDELRNGRIVVLVDENPNVDRAVDSNHQQNTDPSANSVADPISTNPEVAVGSINQTAIDPALDTMDQKKVTPTDPKGSKKH
ncbi:general stress protein [Marinilactibacillus kalidii]|uniref:general stress protein n=1 Tax=Marinilactibacillus kalidii TaxID=2820274 RepID=UPI001ABDCEBB|nr:general stress protein [Marinilactibacillus kalidii]